jgi:hypothetical protein
LAVAIPSLSIYAVFRNRIEVMTAECAMAADRLLAAFKSPVRGAGPSHVVPVPSPVVKPQTHAQ